MSNSRKNIILEKITTYTRQSILDDTFDFHKCNAYDIALDLKIDRSNVSRILNQLFHDFQLIKILGRPTTFISRDIVVNEFRFVKASQSFPDRETFREQLILSNPIHSTNKEDGFHFIGIRIGESLKTFSDEILPTFISPHKKSLIYIIYGEKGVGKKLFCKSLFNHAVKMKLYNKKNKYIIFSYQPFREYNSYITNLIDPSVHTMIQLEVLQPIGENDLYRLKEEIFHVYDNAGKSYPSVFILIDNTVLELDKIVDMTPAVSYFPNLSERTISEKIELILVFLQAASDANGNHIRISNQLITKLICCTYPYNVQQLKDEIEFAISNSIYFTNSRNFVTILFSSFSKKLMDSQTKDLYIINEVTNSINHYLPEFIDLHPNEPCSYINTMPSNRNNLSLQLTKVDVSLSDKIEQDILKTTTNLNAQLISSRIALLLKPTLSNTKFKYDIPLTNKLFTILEQMVHGTFIIENIKDDDIYLENDLSKKLSNTIISKLENAYNTNFSALYRNYIRNYIYFGISDINRKSIVYILICNQKQASENYAQYLNYVSKSRNYYSVEYDLSSSKEEFSQFLDKFADIIQKLDESKEFAIISDKGELTTLAKLVVSRLRYPIISLYPISLPYLLKTYTLMKDGNIHLAALTKEIIDAKKEIKASLAKTTNDFQNEYISRMIGNYFEDYFSSHNTMLSNNSLFLSLKDIAHTLNLPLTNSLVIEYLFHGNFMIERCINRRIVFFENIDDYIEENKVLFDMVKTRISQTKEFISLNINHKEIAIMCDIFIKHINAFEQASHKEE